MVGSIDPDGTSFQSATADRSGVSTARATPKETHQFHSVAFHPRRWGQAGSAGDTAGPEMETSAGGMGITGPPVQAPFIRNPLPPRSGVIGRRGPYSRAPVSFAASSTFSPTDCASCPAPLTVLHPVMNAAASANSANAATMLLYRVIDPPCGFAMLPMHPPGCG